MAVRVPVGDGTPEGVNSAYLLPDRGVVIDPGPPTEAAWRSLRRGIDRSPLSLSDVEVVFVTHWHADHAGLATRLAEAAGARVVLHRKDAPLVGDYRVERERRLDRDATRLAQWGVPTERRATVREGDTPSPLPETYPVVACADGDEVAGATVVHTPGHTAGHAALSTPEGLFVGDLLLPTYTPNVGGSDTRLDDPLAAYLASLSRVGGLADGDAEPGHGTTLVVDEEVAAVHAHHRERARRTFETLATLESATPWEVAVALFGELDGIHVKFGAGEAAAHLRRLAALDLVERAAEEPLRYRPAVDTYPADGPLVM